MQPFCVGGSQTLAHFRNAPSRPRAGFAPSESRRLNKPSNVTSFQRKKNCHANRFAHCTNRPFLRSSFTEGCGHSLLLPRQRALAVTVGDAQPISSAVNSSFLSATAPKSGKRLRVAVDVDEVLGRFVHALNQYVKETYGKDHVVEDFFVYEFAKIWKCSAEESRHIVHEFFESGHFQGGIPVIPGAYEALLRLSQYCDLVVVTSRQHVIQDATLAWIDSNFPGIFTEVYFGNHWALQGASRKKSDICRSIGADILIDDNPVYAQECAAAGIKVLLYDWDLSYPWSKLPPGSDHPNISVVKDWEHVEQEICRVMLETLQQL